MIERAAHRVRKVVEPASRILNYIGIAALMLMVSMLIYSVIMRKFFVPMKGALELSEFGMVLVTFLFISANYFKADQMTMDTFVEKCLSNRCCRRPCIYERDAGDDWQLFAGLEGAGTHQTSVVKAVWSSFIYGGSLQHCTYQVFSAF
jgi:hypothetical protein